MIQLKISIVLSGKIQRDLGKKVPEEYEGAFVFKEKEVNFGGPEDFRIS
ncbi:hypothetical protein FXW07_03405 [Methanosarcina sp. DH1]|nr:hypothetical protein [Methanosarcina sp. DH1]MCC4765702.1 hypothetical protein [Methanosarcina sp. DH1]